MFFLHGFVEQSAGTPNIDIPKVIVEEIEMPVSMSPDW